jgi:hypothetical protein
MIGISPAASSNPADIRQKIAPKLSIAATQRQFQQPANVAVVEGALCL